MIPKVSIILPSLNVSEYISECLNSVVNQSLKDLEIICVDAGSWDGTREILDEYASKDERIVIIDSKKKSYGYQVNVGIEAAKGDYIGIVETDDFVKPDMYEILYKVAVNDNLDLVKGNFWIVTGNKGDYVKEKKYVLAPEDKALFGSVIVDDWEKNFKGFIYTWAGIYKRDFLAENKIKHNETSGAAYQDNGFYFQTMMLAHRVKYIDETLYCLRRDNAESSFFAKDKLDALHYEFDFIHDEIEKRDFQNKEKLYAYCEYLRFRSYLGQERRITDYSFPEFFRCIKNDMWKACLNGELNVQLLNDKQYIYLFYLMSQLSAQRYSSDSYYKAFAEIYSKLMRQQKIYIWSEEHENEINKWLDLFEIQFREKIFVNSKDEIKVSSGTVVLVLGDELINQKVDQIKTIGIDSIVTLWL